MAKNPVLAAFLSFLVPSLGQIYNGKILFGIGLIVLSFIISTLTIVISIFGIILYVVIWLYAIYDAYITAKTLIDD